MLEPVWEDGMEVSMKYVRRITKPLLYVSLCVLLHMIQGGLAFAADPLPSWNEGPAKKAIIEFVQKVTNEDESDFVPIAERIAVFDNDGTLWSEQPFYFQLYFALDRVKELAPQHPEWKDQQPFQAALEGDMKTLVGGGMEGILKLVMATHAGNTTEEFETAVRDWISNARHPKYKRLFTDLAYRPMLELLEYFRANGFKTFIVSGGGVEFMRPWSQRVYGIPPEQVVGSSIKTKFEIRDGKPVILRLPELDFYDDKENKPIGIHRFIGRRPIAAFGNSDGDLAMLQWTAGGPGLRLAAIVHHTDGDREVAYDRESNIGHLDRALDEAQSRDWVVISMKDDWEKVFAYEK